MRKFLVGQKILVVEDNGLVAADTTAILEDAGADVIAAPRIREAVDVAARADISAAVLECPGVYDLRRSKTHTHPNRCQINLIRSPAICSVWFHTYAAPSPNQLSGLCLPSGDHDACCAFED